MSAVCDRDINWVISTYFVICLSTGASERSLLAISKPFLVFGFEAIEELQASAV